MKATLLRTAGIAVTTMGIVTASLTGAHAAMPGDPDFKPGITDTFPVERPGVPMGAKTPDSAIYELTIQRKIWAYVNEDGDFTGVYEPFRKIADGAYAIWYYEGAVIYIEETDEIYVMRSDLYNGYRTVAKKFGAPIVKTEMLSGRISFANGYALEVDWRTGIYRATREYVDSRGYRMPLYSWTFTV